MIDAADARGRASEINLTSMYDGAEGGKTNDNYYFPYSE